MIHECSVDLNPIFFPFVLINAVPLPGFFHDPSPGFGSPMRDVDEDYARLSNREAAALAEGPDSRIPVATVMPEHPPTRAPTSTKPQVSIPPTAFKSLSLQWDAEL